MQISHANSRVVTDSFAHTDCWFNISVGLAPVKEEVKEEVTPSTSLPDIKQEVSTADAENEPDNDPMEDINNKVKDMSSAMGRLVKDPNEVRLYLLLEKSAIVALYIYIYIYIYFVLSPMLIRFI